MKSVKELQEKMEAFNSNLPDITMGVGLGGKSITLRGVSGRMWGEDKGIPRMYVTVDSSTDITRHDISDDDTKLYYDLKKDEWVLKLAITAPTHAKKESLIEYYKAVKAALVEAV